MKFRSAYEKIETKSLRRPIKTKNNRPTLTKQSLAKDLDVNNIIKKYRDTGVLQQMNEFEGIYGDFNEHDLRSAIEMVEGANEMFMEVPSEIRARFDNDAGKFIDYATKPSNIDQMREWGLAKPAPPIDEQGNPIQQKEPEAQSIAPQGEQQKQPTE